GRRARASPRRWRGRAPAPAGARAGGRGAAGTRPAVPPPRRSRSAPTGARTGCRARPRRGRRRRRRTRSRRRRRSRPRPSAADVVEVARALLQVGLDLLERVRGGLGRVGRAELPERRAQVLTDRLHLLLVLGLRQRLAATAA